MRAGVSALCLAAVLLGSQPACNAPDTIQSTLTDVTEAIDRLLRSGELPSEHLQTIRAMHAPGTWVLRRDVEGAGAATREAIRELGAADYTTWHDAGLVVHILSSIGTDHTAALVRSEALDTLARMAPWTLEAVTPPPFRADEVEVIDALKTVREAAGRDDSDPALTARVIAAVVAVGAYRFDEGLAIREGASPRTAAREYRSRLRNARGVLLAFTGSALDGFAADADVRDGMDRAYVSLSAATIRLTLLAAASGDASPTTRATGVRQLSLVQPADAAPAIARVLRSDSRSSVRREAAVALGRFSPDVAVPPLVEALTDGMADVRGAAARALTLSTGEDFGDDRAAWRRWWQARAAQRGKRAPEETAPPATEPGSE